MPGTKEHSGGRREGAGRPRITVTIQMPRIVMIQIEAIAEQNDTTVEDVVREAILSYLSDRQDET